MFPTLPSFASLPTSQPFKRAGLGLFHGKTKRYGNNNPFSKHKTRRTWYPNSHKSSLWSQTLGMWIRTTVTTRVLRTVDKLGGIDNYLLKTKTDLLGWEGMRWRVMVREKKQQLEAEAEAAASEILDSKQPESLLSSTLNRNS